MYLKNWLPINKRIDCIVTHNLPWFCRIGLEPTRNLTLPVVAAFLAHAPLLFYSLAGLYFVLYFRLVKPTSTDFKNLKYFTPPPPSSTGNCVIDRSQSVQTSRQRSSRTNRPTSVSSRWPPSPCTRKTSQRSPTRRARRSSTCWATTTACNWICGSPTCPWTNRSSFIFSR